MEKVAEEVMKKVTTGAAIHVKGFARGECRERTGSRDSSERGDRDGRG